MAAHLRPTGLAGWSTYQDRRGVHRWSAFCGSTATSGTAGSGKEAARAAEAACAALCGDPQPWPLRLARWVGGIRVWRLR